MNREAASRAVAAPDRITKKNDTLGTCTDQGEDMRTRAFHSIFVALSATMLLCSCAGFVVHDDARAKIAADAKQGYADAKITEIADIDRKNLDLLLAAEIAAVRENYRIQIEYAALEIANNSTPMARTWDEAVQRLKELGAPDASDVNDLLRNGVARTNAQHTMEALLKVFAAGGVHPPPCGAAMPELALPPDLDEKIRTRMLNTYVRYKETCAKLGGPQLKPGRMATARDDWLAAKKEVDDAKDAEARLGKELAAAKKDYDDAANLVAEAAKKGQSVSADITGKADKISKVLEAARKLHLGLENEENIGALSDLLAATAGGDVDPKNPDVARAATIAKGIPSLAGDIADLEARRGAPPVSGLLIALKHQTILAEGAKKRVALAEERVAILKAKYDAYYSEVERWSRFTNAMCSYAMLGKGVKYADMKCETFAASADGSCVHDGANVAKCLLQDSWKDRLRSKEGADAKREIYKAIAAYFQALALQGGPLEGSYREIDVRHRETLLSKQNALEQWDNIVSVPLQQLDGYYQGGIKPAEIADLIVKALGLTAIAIGVSK